MISERVGVMPIEEGPASSAKIWPTPSMDHLGIEFRN
jgi:hypothetical protein